MTESATPIFEATADAQPLRVVSMTIEGAEDAERYDRIDTRRLLIEWMLPLSLTDVETMLEDATAIEEWIFRK